MKRLVTLFVLLAILLAVPFGAAADDDLEAEGLSTYAVKAAWGLRLREKAGLTSKTLLVLDCGELVSVIDGLESGIIKNGLRWVEVSVERNGATTTGFVAFKYLTKDLTPNCYLVSWSTEPQCNHGGGHHNGGHHGGGHHGGGNRGGGNRGGGNRGGGNRGGGARGGLLDGGATGGGSD